MADEPTAYTIPALTQTANQDPAAIMAFMGQLSRAKMYSKLAQQATPNATKPPIPGVTSDDALPPD